MTGVPGSASAAPTTPPETASAPVHPCATPCSCSARLQGLVPAPAWSRTGSERTLSARVPLLRPTWLAAWPSHSSGPRHFRRTKSHADSTAVAAWAKYIPSSVQPAGRGFRWNDGHHPDVDRVQGQGHGARPRAGAAAGPGPAIPPSLPTKQAAPTTAAATPLRMRRSRVVPECGAAEASHHHEPSCGRR